MELLYSIIFLLMILKAVSYAITTEDDDQEHEDDIKYTRRINDDSKTASLTPALAPTSLDVRFVS